MLFSVTNKFNATGNLNTVEYNLGYARLLAVGILYRELIRITAEFTGKRYLSPLCGNAGCESESVVFGVEAEHILNHSTEHPTGGSRYPCKEGFSTTGVIGTEVHIRESVGLASRMS